MNNENQNFQQPMNNGYQQPQKNPGKGLSITGLVLGIVSSVFGWFGVVGIVALACGIVGIICAVIGKKKAQSVGITSSGIATAGLVLSIIGTALAGIGVLACFACASCFATAGLGAW